MSITALRNITALSKVVELIFPVRCLGCGRAEVALCGNCYPRTAVRRVRVPGLRAVPVAAGSDYCGAIRAAVVQFKERGRDDVTPALARLLAAAIDDLLQTATLCEGGTPIPIVLIPVPSSARNRRARGGEHMHRLLSRLRAPSHLCRQADALTFVRKVRDAAGLDRDQRARNMACAMQASSPIQLGLPPRVHGCGCR